MEFRVGDDEIENRQSKSTQMCDVCKKIRQTTASQNHQSFAEFLRQNSKQIGEKTKLVKKIRQFTASQILAQFLRENNAAKILVKNTGILKRKS